MKEVTLTGAQENEESSVKLQLSRRRYCLPDTIVFRLDGAVTCHCYNWHDVELSVRIWSDGAGHVNIVGTYRIRAKNLQHITQRAGFIIPCTNSSYRREDKKPIKD
jgi:hypothetical protein